MNILIAQVTTLMYAYCTIWFFEECSFAKFNKNSYSKNLSVEELGSQNPKLIFKRKLDSLLSPSTVKI